MMWTAIKEQYRLGPSKISQVGGWVVEGKGREVKGGAVLGDHASMYLFFLFFLLQAGERNVFLFRFFVSFRFNGGVCGR